MTDPPSCSYKTQRIIQLCWPPGLGGDGSQSSKKIVPRSAVAPLLEAQGGLDPGGMEYPCRKITGMVEWNCPKITGQGEIYRPHENIC